MSRGTIKKVAGPLVIAEGMRDANMYDVVRVSNQRLIGEIIEMHGDQASIQVYEETSGLGPGEPVESMEVPMSVELGPGLIASIYDGIQRPLDDIMKVSGNNLKRGVEVASLKRDKKWNFVPVAKPGDEVEAGDVLGTVEETIVVTQKIMAVSYTHLDVYKRQVYESEEESVADKVNAVLQVHPDVAGYFCTNGNMTKDVLSALKAQEAVQVKVVGFDSGKEQIEAIKSGREVGTIVQNPYGMGYATIVAAGRAEAGMANDSYINSGFQWIDVNNLESEEFANYLYE